MLNLIGPRPAGARPGPTRWPLGPLPLALSLLLLLGGCATGAPPPSLTLGLRPSRFPSTPQLAGSAGGFPAQRTDPLSCSGMALPPEQGKADKGPLRWEAYERMWGWFTRGLVFERLMVELLRADAALPRALRRFLGDFDNPRIEMYVGVWKPKNGLRFADVLVIEQQPPPPGQPPRVETFSFKSRNLSLHGEDALAAQLKADASEALTY